MKIHKAFGAGALAFVALTGAGFTGASHADAAVPASGSVAIKHSVIGGTISRSEVLSRGQNWVNRRIPYSQSRYTTDVDGRHKYRQDCSGFVSMAWHARTSYTTRTLYQISRTITWNSLKPGDAILRTGHHVVLFHHWANSAHTSMVIMEEAHTGTVARKMTYSKSYFVNSGYHPIRYVHIGA